MRVNTTDGPSASLWISGEGSVPKAQVQSVLISLGSTIARVCPEKVLYVSAEIDIDSEGRVRRFFSDNPGASLVWLKALRSRYLLFFHQEEAFFLSKFNDPALAVILFNEIVDYSSYVEYGLLDRDWSDTVLFALNPEHAPSFSSYECFRQQRDHFCYGMDCTATFDTDCCPEWMGYGQDAPEELKNIINNRST